MIELIFAIVILGITMMATPMLISQSSKSNLVSFQQESIAIVASQTSALLTYAWDESNTLVAAGAETAILNVLPLADGGISDDELSVTAPAPVAPLLTFRGNPAFPQARLRRFNPALDLNATAWLGQDGAETDDDIDDFRANPLSLQGIIGNNANQGEYIDVNITLNNQITYVTDITNYAAANINAPALIPIPITDDTSDDLTNIKFLTVTLTSNALAAELNTKNIIMQAFMCNIGSARPATRTGI